ncbi:MAG: hypothetical protein A2W91_14130 [Bacteroidetes bacterium GWF2_38_335]|nr:MAG: hypothetical protein A2W91_14130 [Bacteroidetes bacterium GWF2_38_335]OFY79399.1 MAG: hypothetical protein A2281_17025 [Bacteroidetes bacterium RIFOXYA12_FULL_38_20]HBS85663.1 hypothetical protein [Bacteroidales bacterium]
MNNYLNAKNARMYFLSNLLALKGLQQQNRATPCYTRFVKHRPEGAQAVLWTFCLSPFRAIFNLHGFHRALPCVYAVAPLGRERLIIKPANN